MFDKVVLIVYIKGGRLCLTYVVLMVHNVVDHYYLIQMIQLV